MGHFVIGLIIGVLIGYLVKMYYSPKILTDATGEVTSIIHQGKQFIASRL